MKTIFTYTSMYKINIGILLLKVQCIFFCIHLFTVQTCHGQQYVSPLISPNFIIDCKKEKVITISNNLDQNNKAPIYYFNGLDWQDIKSDSSPVLGITETKAILSEYSNSILIPWKNYLWEYSNGEWVKHSVFDDYFKMRQFENIIELKDSSYLVSVDINYGYYENSEYKTVRQRELFNFKNGQFTFPTINRVVLGASQNFSQMKIYPNGNYSFYTNLYSGIDSTYEYVLFNSTGNVLSKYTVPIIKESYQSAQVNLTDYLFDSKGSIWFLTSSKREFLLDSLGNKVLDTSGFVMFTHNFPGLIEINSNNEINYYNANIGVDSSIYESLSFDIDKDDNIWFIYNNRFSFPDNHFLPTLYKLLSDRKTLQKYSIETILKNSKIYNGGIANEPFEFSYLHKKLKVNNHSGSIYILTSRPLIEFFPERIPSSVSDFSFTPIRLFPNPVQSNNTITIESSVFENEVHPLQVVIRDISGAMINEETIKANGNQLQITTKGFVTGTYFISVLSNNKTILQTKLVKE